MRIPLPTDFKTRTGNPDKDPRQKNSYVELKGDQAILRKRPSAQGGIPIGTGVAQGGIGLNINGVPYFIGFWADTMQPYVGSGSGTYNSTASYGIGDSVWMPDDEDEPFSNGNSYYALLPNSNKNPKTNPYYWSTTPLGTTRYQGRWDLVLGPIAGSADSAGYAAWSANQTYKTCATKHPVSQSWATFEYVDANLKIWRHQWSDCNSAPLYDCSGAPCDNGIVQSPSDIVTIVVP